VFYKLEDFENSVSLYRQSVDLDPEDAMGHFNLGCAYAAAGDFDSAESSWRKAIHFEIEAKLTKKSEEKGKNELEIAVTVMKRPISFDAHKALGYLYLKQKMKTQALKEFLDAIELDPSDPEPYYEAGMILKEEEKERERAAGYFEKYLYLGGEKEDEVKAILKELKSH
jgi:tetratricopeptide (TPR) repeat protein